VIRDICAGLKDTFNAAVLVCSRSGGERQIVVNDVAVERVHSFGDVLSLPAAPTYPWRLWRRIAEHDLLALHAPFPLADSSSHSGSAAPARWSCTGTPTSSRKPPCGSSSSR